MEEDKVLQCPACYQMKAKNVGIFVRCDSCGFSWDPSDKLLHDKIATHRLGIIQDCLTDVVSTLDRMATILNRLYREVSR